jgi:hypothetical protein
MMSKKEAQIMKREEKAREKVKIESQAKSRTRSKSPKMTIQF